MKEQPTLYFKSGTRSTTTFPQIHDHLSQNSLPIPKELIFRRYRTLTAHPTLPTEKKTKENKKHNTRGGANQQDPTSGQTVGDPLADGDHIPDLGEARERGPAGGLSGAPGVEGDGAKAFLGEGGGDALQEGLAAAKEGEGVDEDDDLGAGVGRGGGVEEAGVELHAIGGLHFAGLDGVGCRRRH